MRGGRQSGSTQEKVSDASHAASALLCVLNPHFDARVSALVVSTVLARGCSGPQRAGNQAVFASAAILESFFHSTDSRGHLKLKSDGEEPSYRRRYRRQM